MNKTIADTMARYGLREKTFMEKARDADKKRILLYAALTAGAVFGLRKFGLPLIAGIIAGR